MLDKFGTKRTGVVLGIEDAKIVLKSQLNANRYFSYRSLIHIIILYIVTVGWVLLFMPQQNKKSNCLAKSTYITLSDIARGWFMGLEPIVPLPPPPFPPP